MIPPQQGIVWVRVLRVGETLRVLQGNYKAKEGGRCLGEGIDQFTVYTSEILRKLRNH